MCVEIFVNIKDKWMQQVIKNLKDYNIQNTNQDSAIYVDDVMISKKDDIEKFVKDVG